MIESAEADYSTNKAQLDRVPLDQFTWFSETKQQSPAGTHPEFEAPWGYMAGRLPSALLERLKRTHWTCTTVQDKMSLDSAQMMISGVLEQAEALQTQVLTENW